MSTTTIRSTGAPRWMMAALGLLTALFLWAALMPHAFAATTPAGTVIGNQATATFVDGTGTTRNTLSNLVQTTVSQVKSFTLTANGAKTGAPGQTVYYPHTISNTGNGSDSFTLNVPATGGGFTHTGLAYYADANGDGLPDNAIAITTTGLLAAGTQFKFVVGAVIPAGATLGQTGTVTVSVSDTSGGAAVTNTDTTTVANSAINVTKAMSVTSGPSPSAASITVTLTYTNSGTVAASNLTLSDVLPAGMNYVTGSGLWSSSGTALTDAAAGDPAGIDYSYTAASRTVSAVVTSVAAGATGNVTFKIDIASGLAPSTLTNTASFSTATQSSTNTNSVSYIVAATASVAATGQTVASAPQGATLLFTNTITNNGNATDSFDVTYPATGSAGNNFPVGTTFALLQADGITTLLDTNGNGTPDTGPLAVGASYQVKLRVTLPAGATGGPLTVVKTATSKNDPTKSATASDTLTAIVAATLDLTQNTARTDSTPAGTAAAGNAATTGFGVGTASVIATNSVTPNPTAATQTTFSLVVNNTSGAADSYNLSLASALPTGWSASFYNASGASCAVLGSSIASTGSIAAGTNKLVCAVVTVPSINSGNAAAGTSNLTFRAESVLSASISDTIVDAVTVTTVRNITLTPNGSQQTYPGGSVTYSHDLSNLGNASETISFASGFLADSLVASGWTSVAYLDSNSNGTLEVGTDTLITTASTVALAANSTRQIFVRVFAPGSLTADNFTTLIATFTGGTASVSDRTSLTNGLLLSKAQVAGTCAAALVAGPFNVADIVAGPNTAPGKCVAYQITATNTTVGAITTVVLSDTVPANTTLAATSCAAPAATGGATLGGTLTEGATGALTASLASLASGASFQFTFCVKINP